MIIRITTTARMYQLYSLKKILKGWKMLELRCSVNEIVINNMWVHLSVFNINLSFIYL